MSTNFCYPHLCVFSASSFFKYLSNPLFLVLSVFIWIHFVSFSQEEKGLTELNERIATYENEDYVIVKALIEVDILRDEKSGRPVITRKEKIVFQSLKDNVRLIRNYYHNNNSTIEKVKGDKFFKSSGDVNSNMIFHSDRQFVSFSKFLKQKGDITVLEIVEKYEDYKFYTREAFFYDVPVIQANLKIKVNSNIQLKVLSFNTDSFELKRDTLINKLENTRTEIIKLCNITAYKTEDNATPISCNYPHCLVNIQSYVSKNGEVIPVYETVDDLYRMYKSLILKTNNDTIALRPLLNSIVSDADDTLQMVEKIYKWVQQKIRYIAFEYEMEGYIPADAAKVVEDRYGDCKGVSNLLQTFLTMQGLDARLCWISATQSPYDYSIPSIVVDNHMICVFVYRGKPIILDATHPYNNLLDVPDNLQGKQLLIENGDYPWIYDIPVDNPKSNISDYEFNVRAEGTQLLGTINALFRGNQRALLLTVLNEMDVSTNDIISKGVLHRNRSVVWNNDDSSLNIEGDSLITFSSEVQLNGKVFTNQNQMYVKLFPLKINEIQQEDTNRISDIKLHLRNYVVQRVNFTIPEFYKVQTLPNDTLIPSPIGEIKYSYTVTDSTIQYCRTYSNKQLFLPKEAINDWNQFVKKVSYEDNRRIVLYKP